MKEDSHASDGVTIVLEKLNENDRAWSGVENPRQTNVMQRLEMISGILTLGSFR